MSGGHFDYRQYEFSTIADSIESTLLRQGKKKEKDELWGDAEYYRKYPDDLFYYTYPEEVQNKFREAITILRKAFVYVHRIDWLLSGDDGEETFIERLAEELIKLEKEKDENMQIE
jgi:hypothetical protein